ncbi:MAG: hypothetical protein GXP54_04080 [Deltaproteobacteria bacterium]|nr:hypothetical protein [Deltaproteobacteria bacterium]
MILALALVCGCGSASEGWNDAETFSDSHQDALKGDEPENGFEVLEATDTLDATITVDMPLFTPMLQAPQGSVLPDSVDSCGVYRDIRCKDGKALACSIYDSGKADWSLEPPAMTEQAFMFDRYYDLYHQVEGQAMDVRFTKTVLAGTPEHEWSKPEYFRMYDGYGDASGWSGTALGGAAGRYASTGTDADYDRMLSMFEKVMFQYEVNDVPGMLVRSHWAMLPEGAPDPAGNWGKAIAHFRPDDGSEGFIYPIAQKFLDRLPEYYRNGVDINGTHYDTLPRFQGDASRDMYVRGLPGILMAWDLLKDGQREDAVRKVVRREIPCTLNRMKKGRIYNLDANPDLKEALMSYIAGNGETMILEPGELETFTSLSEIVFYAMEQPHPAHMDLFNKACPDGPPMDFDPSYEFDAGSPTFLLDLMVLLSSMQGGGDRPLAWAQYVSVRGADALFVTQWALAAQYLTGDARYLEFLRGLMDEIDYWDIIHTYGALQMPIWCTPHFGPSLLYPTLWNLLGRIDKTASPGFWTNLSEAVVEEGKNKDMKGREDAYWGILYNRMADDSTDPEHNEYVQHFVHLLATYGMNPDDKLEPDRNYPRNFVDNPDPEIPLIEPTEDEIALCTEPITIMGIEVPAAGLEDDWPRAKDAVPLPKRVGGGFLWTIDPWMVKREYGGTGMNEQWPMLGMTVPYWIGRSDGVISEGQGMALGWRETGETCPDQ